MIQTNTNSAQLTNQKLLGIHQRQRPTQCPTDQFLHSVLQRTTNNSVLYRPTLTHRPTNKPSSLQTQTYYFFLYTPIKNIKYIFSALHSNAYNWYFIDQHYTQYSTDQYIQYFILKSFQSYYYCYVTKRTLSLMASVRHLREYAHCLNFENRSVWHFMKWKKSELIYPI